MREICASPVGNDNGSGAAADPVRTLTRARDLLRGAGPDASKRLLLAPGRYDDTCLELDARDSRLTIETAGDIPAVLCGGHAIGGWRPDGDGFVAADVAPGWDFRMLAVNGQWRPRSRYPATGFLECLNTWDVPWMSTTGGGWKRPPTAAELGHLDYRPGDLPAGFQWRNAELTVFHSWDESLVGLAGHDAAARRLVFATPAGHPPGSFASPRYVINNIRAGLTAPGQWYLDRVRNCLVYWPLPDEDMAGAEVLAPVHRQILCLAGSEAAPVVGVTVSGVAFAVAGTPMVAGGFAAAAMPGAIEGRHTPQLTVRDCRVAMVGGHALKVDAAPELTVEGCDVAWTGAGGLYGKGDDLRLVGNHIHHVGRAYASAVAMRTGGAGQRLLGNDVHHTPYSGIASSGRDSLFADNRFRRVMEVMNDGAAIYITFCQRMTVRGNRTEDIAKGLGLTHAYYLDEQAEDCLVEGNLAVGVRSPLHSHMARRNIWRQNVAVNDGELILSYPRCEDCVVERNVVAAGGSIRCRWPVGAIARFADNVLHSATGEIVEEVMEDYGAIATRPLVPADGTVFADPRFVDPAAGDYRFAADSPALVRGISSPVPLP